ncbi:MAG: AAA family ATPase, partial [Candidatus Acidiferrales bacterium]
EEIERFKAEREMVGDEMMEVTQRDVEEIISSWTDIPVTSIEADEAAKLINMEEILIRRIVGQDRAIRAISRAIRRSRLGVASPNRPMGSYIFLGSSGVGKTEVARRLAEFLFGSQKHLIRFDMSEYMEKHAVSKLIGAPPGYVGYEEGGQLTERVRRSPYSVILLDEIEKAHPDVFNILLQVFEDGQLTDGLGTTVDFKNAILIMTSNIGARYLQKRPTLGFAAPSEEATQQKVEEMILSEVKRVFNPEFLNRLDEVIIFNALADDDLLKIIDLLVEQINENVSHRGVSLQTTPEARQWLLEKTCGDRSYGARPLRRALQKYIEDPLSEQLITGQVQPPATLEVIVDSDHLGFRSVLEPTAVH